MIFWDGELNTIFKLINLKFAEHSSFSIIDEIAF